MRLRTYIGLTSGCLVILILCLISYQTRRILDRGFRELGAKEVGQAAETVRSAIRSKREILTNFKRLIAADKKVTPAIRNGRLRQTLQEMKELGRFDFVDYILPNGTSAFGNEKRFGSGIGVEKTLDDEGFGVVKMDGKILLASFCLKHREHGILVIGYYLTGDFEKELSRLTASDVTFVVADGDARKPSTTTAKPSEVTVIDIAQFPSKTLKANVSLDWSWIEGIDSRLRTNLLYSGIICVLFLLCLMYFFLEVGFVKRFETILGGIKEAAYDLEKGRVAKFEFKNHPISDLQWLSESFSKFSDSVGKYSLKSKELAIASVRAEQHAALTAQAQQVAHDIRSPLSALELFLETFDQLPDETRTIMKGCVTRVIDVANSLLTQFKETESESIGAGDPELTGEKPTIHRVNSLLISLIDPIISEKRIQYKNRANVRITYDLDGDAYGLFSTVSPQIFKRNLSNVIDNAVESMDQGGEVKVTLHSHASDKVRITVKDNGSGISEEVLKELGKKGRTFGKEKGSGLGIYYAKSAVEEAGGSFTISSTPGKGTTIDAVLVKAAIPEWFVPELQITPNSTVVILDDDPSIHHLWDERFRLADLRSSNVELVHLLSASECEDWHRKNAGSLGHTLYLCDYELRGQPKTGLDVIESLGIEKQSVLVTTHFENSEIRERCSRLGVRLVPKILARFVPITRFRRSTYRATQSRT